MDQLLAPPPDLPPHLQRYRVWIWLQLVAIRVYVLAVRGPGTSFLLGCDETGNIQCVILGDAPAERRVPSYTFTPSKALQTALQGDSHLDAILCQLRLRPHPGQHPALQIRLDTVNARHMPSTINLPLPDT